MMSTVLFQTGSVVPHLPAAVAAGLAQGAEVLLDAYHAFGAMPQPLSTFGDPSVFVVSGGYKYAQWGEGVCWMRVPTHCQLRPVYTGWFSDFSNLDQAQDGVSYGSTPSSRFAGSTYDPASHYRAAAVIDFFRAQGMSMTALRSLSSSQTQRIIDGLSDWDILTPRAPGDRGGFVSVRTRDAGAIVRALRALNIFTDSRADILRIGPAPYTTDDEIDSILMRLAELRNAAR